MQDNLHIEQIVASISCLRILKTKLLLNFTKA